MGTRISVDLPLSEDAMHIQAFEEYVRIGELLKEDKAVTNLVKHIETVRNQQQPTDIPFFFIEGSSG